MIQLHSDDQELAILFQARWLQIYESAGERHFVGGYSETLRVGTIEYRALPVGNYPGPCEVEPENQSNLVQLHVTIRVVDKHLSI